MGFEEREYIMSFMSVFVAQGFMQHYFRPGVFHMIYL
jgi:hypothetical protein